MEQTPCEKGQRESGGGERSGAALALALAPNPRPSTKSYFEACTYSTPRRARAAGFEALNLCCWHRTHGTVTDMRKSKSVRGCEVYTYLPGRYIEYGIMRGKPIHKPRPPRRQYGLLCKL